jgi:acetyl esterase/lipase
MTISAEARRDLAGRVSYGTYPSPTDLDAWRFRLAAESKGNLSLEAEITSMPVHREQVAMAGAKVSIARPHTRADAAAEKAILYFHSGSLVFGSGLRSVEQACATAKRFSADTYGVDYRVPPDFPFPAGLDDCLDAYRGLLERMPPGAIALVGTSAGANLAAATLLRARDEGLPMPAAMVLEWPQVDLTESGDTFQTHRNLDPACGSLAESNALYAAGHPLSDPLVSPLFGNFTGFPPTLIVSGTRDIMLSNAVMLHRAMRRAGVAADLNVWEAAPHGGFGLAAPESREMLWEEQRFLFHHWRRCAA